LNVRLIDLMGSLKTSWICHALKQVLSVWKKSGYLFDVLLRDVVNQMHPLLGEREVHIFSPDDLVPVEIDVVQIEQVITNLLENVIRYTPEGSSLDLHIQTREEYLQVSVADRGPGIPLPERERIFDKFYRVSRSGSVLVTRRV
jgi:two-component system sensor histidine kinase KdpD